MKDKSPKQATVVEKFWDAFKACAADNRIRPDRSLFYVKWAQTFVDFLPGKRLRERSRKDIEDFLADLIARPGIVEWRARRHPLHESLVQKAVKEAASRAGITKRVSCHTSRHSGVYPATGGTTHLLEAGYDIRTVQELWDMRMSPPP